MVLFIVASVTTWSATKYNISYFSPKNILLWHILISLRFAVLWQKFLTNNCANEHRKTSSLLHKNNTTCQHINNSLRRTRSKISFSFTHIVQTKFFGITAHVSTDIHHAEFNTEHETYLVNRIPGLMRGFFFRFTNTSGMLCHIKQITTNTAQTTGQLLNMVRRKCHCKNLL
jgi:hypothetical protein